MAKRTKSALKANRQNVKRREQNRQMRSKLRTDIALKSSGGEPRILLERLVVELCGDATARKGPSYGRR